jgi:4-hydroxybenzoate polyprenyltransferase
VRLVGAVLRSSHPGPTLMVTVLTVVLGLAVGVPAGRLAVVTVAVLAGQLAIGLSNDVIDAERDRSVGRRDKPIAQGIVSARTIAVTAIVCAVIGFGLPFTVGLGTGVAHAVLVASGLAYNAGLKTTPASVLPFVVSFGVLPAVVTLADAPPAAPALWALGVGAVFGVAIHFTNVLPDLADDARTGIVGLPHRLGRLRAGLVAFGALAVAAGLALVGQLTSSPIGTTGPALAVVGAAVVVVLAGLGAAAVLHGRSSRLLFRLIMASALLLVAQLAVGGAALTMA